jgi:hypothetical protein
MAAGISECSIIRPSCWGRAPDGNRREQGAGDDQRRPDHPRKKADFTAIRTEN